MTSILISSCACGKVRFRGTGRPILSAVCYCDDCQAGSRQIEALSGAPSVMDTDGGTPYLIYRDDRLQCISGKELLKGCKLKDKSPTQRFVATCCNSGMYLKFKPGHWSSAYRMRFEGDLPPIEMRTQTQFRNDASPIPDDAPNYRRFPVKLFTKLISAKLAMWFGR